MSAAPKVSSHDIRKIIFDNFNDTDTRFSNDDILIYLSQMDRYKTLDDVLDFEDQLLAMEKSGLLRPIAQNFNTRYYRLWNTLVPLICKSCNFVAYFAQTEEGKSCPQCKATI
jgi:predicted Zn-ribbon and HTH transcriptional regulator